MAPPNRTALARLDTPLMALPRLGREIGVALWVKRDDMTGSVMGGNKVRKLEYVIADALAQGADTLITCGGTQSNHCRATAIACAQLGLRAHLVLAGDSLDHPDGNLLLDRLAGATITLGSPELFGTALNAEIETIATAERRAGHKPYVVPLGASFEPGLWGYIGAVAELKTDCAKAGFSPEILAFATGSGGTQGGLVLGNAMYDLGARIVGYSVASEAGELASRVREQMRQWKTRYRQDIDVDSLPVEIDDRTVGAGYGQADDAVFETIARVGRLEGLVLDPVYTGKAMHGLLTDLSHGKLKGARNAVFLHTGGVFGIFPQRGNFPA